MVSFSVFNDVGRRLVQAAGLVVAFGVNGCGAKTGLLEPDSMDAAVIQPQDAATNQGDRSVMPQDTAPDAFMGSDAIRPEDAGVIRSSCSISRHGVERVSVATGGAQSNGDSFQPSITDDNRYVAFTSTATNLVSGDTNGVEDVFIHDRLRCETQRVSVGPGGTQANGRSVNPVISGNGLFLSFGSCATNLTDTSLSAGCRLYVRNLTTGTNQVVRDSTGDSISSGVGASLSASDNPLNGDSIVYNDDGFPRPSLLGVQNFLTQNRRAVDVPPPGYTHFFPSNPYMTRNAQFIGFQVSLQGAGVMPDGREVGPFEVAILRDMSAPTYEVVGIDPADRIIQSRNVSVSDDGNTVAFSRSFTRPGAPPTTSLFIRDRARHATREIESASALSPISRTGRHIFYSGTGPQTVHDLQTNEVGSIARVTLNGSFLAGVIGGVISADDSLLVMHTSMETLIEGDTNSDSDIFVVPMAPLFGR